MDKAPLNNFIINIIDEKPVDGTNMTESIVLLGDQAL
jgi:hypothetical protein